MVETTTVEMRGVNTTVVTTGEIGRDGPQGEQGEPGDAGPQGDPGPQGEPGEGGGAVQAETFIQNSPDTDWLVTHSLPFRPNVTVVDSGGSQVEGTVLYTGSTTLTISFSAAFSGRAYLS